MTRTVLLPFSWLSQLSNNCDVFIVGITRKKDDVSQSLTMATRLGIEQEIPIPNTEQRSAVRNCQDRILVLFMSKCIQICED